MTHEPLPTASLAALAVLVTSLLGTHYWMLNTLYDRCECVDAFYALMSVAIVAPILGIASWRTARHPRRLWALTGTYWLLLAVLIWPVLLWLSNQPPWWST